MLNSMTFQVFKQERLLNYKKMIKILSSKIAILFIVAIFISACNATKPTTKQPVSNTNIQEKKAVFVPNLKIAKQGTVLKNKKKDAFKAKFGLVNIILRNDTLFAKCTHGGGCGKTNFFLNEYLSNNKEVAYELLARSNDKCRKKITTQVYFLIPTVRGKKLKVKHHETIVYDK